MNIAIPDLIAIFLSGFGILLCLVVGIQLLFRKEGMRQSNLLLGVLLILYALTLTNGLLAMAGIFAQYQFLYFLPINFSLSIGPLFYFFVRSRVQPSFRLQRRHLPHFVLPSAQFIFYLSIGFRSTAYKSWIWQEVIRPYAQFIEEGLFISLAAGYLVATYRLLHQEVPEEPWKSPVYRWLRRFTLSLAFLALIGSAYEIADWILFGVFEYNLFNTPWLAFPLKLAYAGISLLIGYNAYLHQNQSLILPRHRRLSTKGPELSAKIDKFFELRKPHLDPELSLDSFAKLLGVHRNTISRVLSSRGESFRGVVNRHRVEEFIRLVQEGQHEHLTMLAIAFESGFNSKASFNRAFKSHTGSSPTEYFQA